MLMRMLSWIGFASEPAQLGEPRWLPLGVHGLRSGRQWEWEEWGS